jgi:hypothetical protein
LHVLAAATVAATSWLACCLASVETHMPNEFAPVPTP